MAEPASPQLYLVTPQHFEIDTFATTLARVLDAREIACLRLSVSADDPDHARRAADRLRDVAHARDVAVVATDHAALIDPHGLDGIHLSDGPGRVRDLRKQLGADRIVGAMCGQSRHSGMTAAEIGADYVSFGPAEDNGLGDEIVEDALFQWWSEMIEVPQVAEGILTAATAAKLSPIVDFIALGGPIWAADDPLEAIDTLLTG
ncbi:MAG: thiamine phosphate synthase [Pseudomonadota bacterium]